MNEMSPPALLRLLLLEYGHVAQAFLPLLASPTEWLRNRFVSILLEGYLTPHLIRREGIRSLSINDIRTAALQGTPLRLVSQASRKNGSISAEVSPQHIHAGDVLHIGKGPMSIISLETEAMGTITLIEHEPTVMQTAYGLLSDLITVLQQCRLL